MRGGPGQSWLLMGAVSLGVYLILRVGFGIPFWVVAVAVVFLSVVGSVLFGSGRDAVKPAPPRSAPTNTSLDNAQREERFVLSEADLLAGKGVSGFALLPGQSIGGGRFPKVGLDPGEEVILAVGSGRAGSILRASLGYLTLTDQHLIFVGEKPLCDILGFLPGRAGLLQLRLSYSAIETVQLAKRYNLGMILGSMRAAVVIRTKSGREHVFWPNVFDLDAFVLRLRALQSSA